MKSSRTFVILLACCWLCMVQCSGKTLPVEAAGKWTTTDENFKGEYIDISKDAVVFGVDGAESYRYRIVKVKSEKGPLYGSTLYRVYCTDETGDENVFTFIFSTRDGGTLYQKSSQDVPWKRS